MPKHKSFNNIDDANFALQSIGDGEVIVVAGRKFRKVTIPGIHSKFGVLKVVRYHEPEVITYPQDKYNHTANGYARASER